MKIVIKISNELSKRHLTKRSGATTNIGTAHCRNQRFKVPLKLCYGSAL